MDLILSNLDRGPENTRLKQIRWWYGEWNLVKTVGIMRVAYGVQPEFMLLYRFGLSILWISVKHWCPPMDKSILFYLKYCGTRTSPLLQCL